MTEELIPAVRRVAAPLVALLIISGGAAAAREAPDEIGVLTCSISTVGNEIPSPGEGEPPGKGHDLFCTFTPYNSGLEETYVGLMQLVGEAAMLQGRAMMWAVKSAHSTEMSPGLLEQTYSPAAAAQPGQVTPLTGDTNSALILQSMAERNEDTPKTQAPGVVITAMALKLRSSPA